MMRIMRKRFFIGAALSVLLMGFPVIEPVAAETTPEEATHAMDNRKPHAGGFIRFNGFRYSSGKSVMYPGLSSMTTDTQVKSKKLQRFDTYGSIDVEEQTRIINYPILSIDEGTMTAFQLSMPYDATAVEILGMTTPIAEAGIAYNILNDELQFRWTSRTPVEIHTGDTLAFLKLYLKHKPNSHIARHFRIHQAGYKVNRTDNGDRSENWRMALPEIALYRAEHRTPDHSAGIAATDTARTKGLTELDKQRETLLKQQGGQASRFEILSIIPNPMKSWADITYSIFGDCTVRLRLYSLLGEEIMTIVNSGRQTGLYRHNITVSDVAAGVYILRLETCQENVAEPSDIMKVVVQN